MAFGCSPLYRWYQFLWGGGGSHFGLKRPPEVCVGIRATFENANIGTASVAFGEGQGHLHPYITTSRPWLYYYCSVSFAKHIIIFSSSYLIISLSTWLVVGSQSSLKQHLNSYPRAPDRDNENPVCWNVHNGNNHPLQHGSAITFHRAHARSNSPDPIFRSAQSRSTWSGPRSTMVATRNVIMLMLHNVIVF